MQFYLMLILALFIWNLIVFFLYFYDKQKAKKGAWRISEKSLLLCAFLFGGIGGFFGMHVFRHKTKHTLFKIFLPFAFVLTCLFIGFIVWFGILGKSI